MGAIKGRISRQLEDRRQPTTTNCFGSVSHCISNKHPLLATAITLQNKMPQWLLPAVGVAVEQMLQILFVSIAAMRGRVQNVWISVAQRLRSCHTVFSLSAFNLTASSSSAKCLFNLPKETQVVSLAIPAQQAPPFSLTITVGERRRERERAREGEIGVGEENQIK